MNSINYESIRSFGENRTTSTGYGSKLYKYCSLIVALRLCSWKHRDIVEYLLSVAELNSLITAHKIDNQKLCKLVSQWRIKNLIDYEAVEEERRLILGDSYVSDTDRKKSAYGVSIVTDKRWNEFLKHYYKLSGKPISDELPDLKAYYENYKNVDIGIEYLAEQCLAEKNSRLSQ
nr:hypothetical protein [Janthinobacterium sp. Marseille]